MVRTLEIEKSVNGKLRESLKFTFTPKAISQQQLLTDCLQDFETELERLAIKLGKTLSPPLSTGDHSSDEASSTVDSQNTSSSKKGKRNARADTDTERLITNLENETQHVSKGIMTLARSIERMKTLMDAGSHLKKTKPKWEHSIATDQPQHYQSHVVELPLSYSYQSSFQEA